MAEPIPLPIANGFYESDSLPISSQECVNLYPNIVQAAALNQETLFGTPGLEQLGTSGISTDDINRESHKLGDNAYFVNGGFLYRINSDDTIENQGAITGSGRISMADNGTQLMILVPGGDGFIFTESPDTLKLIDDPDFKANGNPQHVLFIDTFFLCTTDTKKFIISEVNNGLAWDGTDFGTAEADPDDIVAPIKFRNQLFIGGSETFEAFTNRGGEDFPFQRNGLFIEKGIAAAFSVINIDQRIMWVGGGENESAAVWMMTGTSNLPEKVSTTAVDTVFQRLTAEELADVFAWSYAQKGAYFVAFSLPNTTFTYDTVSKRWHERKSKVTLPSGITQTVRSRVNSLVTAYGKVLVGDSQDGRIGSMDIDIFMEYDTNINRSFSTQPFQNNMRGMFVPALELTMESGVGNSDEPDPTVRMSRSKNGKTFTDDRTARIGKAGEFDLRQQWFKNGFAKRWETFKFAVSAPCKIVFIQLTAGIAGATK